MSRDEIYYMKKAVAQARKAYAIDEVPVGAVLVDEQGAIVGTGYNQVEKKKQQQAHAEMIAIARAAKKRGDWRLNGCALYVTLQPCAMCMGLIQLSRISLLVYGCQSKLFGYQLDKEGAIQLYNRDIAVQAGVLSDDAAQLLKQFFKQKRIRSG
ncbi:MAG: nucleoside deaminase [Candidatus Babeliales bacterium]